MKPVLVVREFLAGSQPIIILAILPSLLPADIKGFESRADCYARQLRRDLTAKTGSPGLTSHENDPVRLGLLEGTDQFVFRESRPPFLRLERHLVDHAVPKVGDEIPRPAGDEPFHLFGAFHVFDGHIHPFGMRSEEVEDRLIEMLVIRVAHSSLEIVMTVPITMSALPLEPVLTALATLFGAANVGEFQTCSPTGPGGLSAWGARRSGDSLTFLGSLVPKSENVVE